MRSSQNDGGRFATLYNPSRVSAIDEAMVPYKGRSTMKQYMPKKLVRRGLKVWMRADSANCCFTVSSLCWKRHFNRERTGSQSKCVGRALHDGREEKWRAMRTDFWTTPSFLAVTPTFPRYTLIFHTVIFKTANLPPLYNCTGLPLVCSA